MNGFLSAVEEQCTEVIKMTCDEMNNRRNKII
jgi:hypothetical protein